MNIRIVMLSLLLCYTGSRCPAQSKSSLAVSAVDHILRTEWKTQKIIPSAPINDATYLRRVWLDIAGIVPPADVVRAFLSSKLPDKRARAVEDLLSSPRYSVHWTNYWDNLLMGNQVRNPLVDRVSFREWLQGQFTRNAPYNQFVRELVSATGQNSPGGSYARALGMPAASTALASSAAATANGSAKPGDSGMEMESPSANSGSNPATPINGAVNWTLKYAQNTADLTGTASKLFLGVQIQCAQCHDHKTEKWKQDDFKRFAACFTTARPVFLSDVREKGVVRRVELRDLNRPFLGGKKDTGRRDFAKASPTALDGTDFSTNTERRKALAAWMTAPENPWFARAIVNRIWAYFLGRGFVNPVDDFRDSNPPVMPALLNRLAEDFIAHNYDLKHLIRTITATQAYQLSASAATGKSNAEIPLWSRYRLKPMEPDTLLDSLMAATGIEPVLEKVAGGSSQQVRFLMQKQFGFLFDVDEEFEQKDFEGTIPQALLLLNGNLVNRGASPIPGTALAETLALPGGTTKKIEALYLRTLSRLPTTKEYQRWTTFITAQRTVVETDGQDNKSGIMDRRLMRGRILRKGRAPDPLNRFESKFRTGKQTPEEQAYEDMFWALLNSSEFAFNH